jgi:diphosphoinositol-polyphosphate diphosphatase
MCSTVVLSSAIRLSLLDAPVMPSSRVGGPQPTFARTGRELQRYSEDGARLVAGCIPVRVKQLPGEQPQLEVMLVTSRAGKGWGFPKGGWEVDESVEAAAARETVEEAGVRGDLEVEPLGIYTFSSSKAARLHGADQGRCVAHMYVMHVAEELPIWPEGQQRRRVWFPVPEASKACRHQWMRDALHTWLRRSGHEQLIPSDAPDST